MRPHRAPPPPTSPDHRVAALAAEQGGVVSVQQLLGCGLSMAAVQRRAQRGWLHRLHRGIYAVGHPRLSALGRRMAAVLACGAGAVVSHRTAADAWDIRASSSPTVDVLVPRHHGRRGHAGVRLRRTATLGADEVTHLGPLPITRPERTLLDLAALLRQTDLVRAVEQAEKLRIADFAVLEALARRPAPGVAKLRAALGIAPDRTRSQLERRFLALCTKAGLPAPQVNVQLGLYEVDFLWPQERLVVELDSRLHHHTRQAFERDRRRDADLVAAGFRVVRVTDLRLDEEPDAVTALVAGLRGQPAASRAPWR